MNLRRLFCLIALFCSVSVIAETITLQDSADEIFRLIQERNPVILGQMTKEQIRDSLSLMLDASETGLAIVEEPEKPAAKAEPVSYPPQMFAEDRLLYLRADSLALIPEKWPETMHPLGIVLDLRFCQTGTDERAIMLSKRIFGVPAAILIGPGTSGAAEIAAALLVKGRKALSLGEETNGTPYPAEYVFLQTGGYLRIPMPPENLKEIPYRPVLPMIEVIPEDNAPVGLGKAKDSWQEDIVLRRAGELLLALDRLTQKGAEK